MTSIKTTVLAGLCAIAAFSAALSSAAMADPITYAGTFSIADASPAGNALTVQSDPAAFSVPLSYGNKVSNITLATFQTTDTNTGSYVSDKIEGTFKFAQPVYETNSVDGSVGQLTISFFGSFLSNGGFAWDTNDLTVSFSDGSALEIDLHPSTFNVFGSSGSQVVSADFTLTSEPVPEPMSIAMLGVGILGMGTIARRRRSTTATA